MKGSRPRFLFLALVCILALSSPWATVASDELDNQGDPSAQESDQQLDINSLIEENPDYVEEEVGEGQEDEIDDDKGDDNDAEEDDYNDDDQVEPASFVDQEMIRKKIEDVLSQSQQHYKKLITFAKKNRKNITIALAVFAFRQEIKAILVHLITREIMDPKTKRLRFSPTSMLKLMLFVDMMRRLQSGQNASQPTFQNLVALAQSNPLWGLFLSFFLRIPVFNPAYIPPVSQHYTFERINERYIKDGMALHKAIHSKHEGFKWPMAEPVITRSMIAKPEASLPFASNPFSSSMISSTTSSSSQVTPSEKGNSETVIILDLTHLDSSVSGMEQIRDQVSFLLSEYRASAMKTYSQDGSAESEEEEEKEEVTPPPLEVVVLLESPGGSAADYGLAAQQLCRLRKQSGLTLTICVDKVAASGGYMMACAATPGQLFASPFAVVGSIGVLGQLVNIHKLLEGWGLSPLVFRGGKDKAPLGMIGEVTEDGMEKTQAIIDSTHEAFRRYVVESRPVLEQFIDVVGNGDIYIGAKALGNGLVDKLITSDEYISSKISNGARVLKLVKNRRPKLPFGVCFDNYDTSVKNAPDVSIRSMIGTAWMNIANFLGASAKVTPDMFRRAVSVTHPPKISIQ